MSKLSLKLKLLGGIAPALVIAGAVSTPAFGVVSVPDGLYAGGSTFQEKVVRDIMNCYGAHSGTETELPAAATHTCNGGDAGFASPYKSTVELLYVGVGSGNALKSWNSGDTSKFDPSSAARKPDNPPVVGTTDLGSFYGTGVGTSWVPDTAGYTSGDPATYTKISFIGSDDPITSIQSGVTTYLDNYNTAKGGKGWGNAVQLPALIGGVSIAYHQAAQWNEKGKGGGGASKLDLSTETWCGIYTGAITDWQSIPTADNGTKSLTNSTSQPIHVVVRNDGSGTTFLFVNALIHQCATTTHPVPASWQTASGNTSGVSNNNWFINVNAAALLPANFSTAKGSGGIHDAIAANAAWTGYLSADFTHVTTVGPDNATDGTHFTVVAANLQTYASFLAGGTKVWKAPTFGNASKVMTYSALEPTTYLKPPSFVAGCASLPEGCASDPAAWGKTNPTPNSKTAYPIGGYTFWDMYTCYHNLSDVTDMFGTTAGSLGYVRWYYGTAAENAGKPKASLNKNQFATVPGTFLTNIKKLLTTNAPTKAGVDGVTVGNPGYSISCSGLTGGA